MNLLTRYWFDLKHGRRWPAARRTCLWLLDSVALLALPAGRRAVLVGVAPTPRLTEQQMTVLLGLLDEKKVMEIAEQLGGTTNRVRALAKEIIRAYELPNIRLVLRIARRFGVSSIKKK